MSNSEMETFCKDNNVVCQATYMGLTKRDHWAGHAWRAVLSREGYGVYNTYTTDFYTGTGLVSKSSLRGGKGMPIKPTAADVISSIAAEASACEQTFEDWASDLGYDNDSIKALDTYLACQKEATAMRKWCQSVGLDFEAIRGLER